MSAGISGRILPIKWRRSMPTWQGFVRVLNSVQHDSGPLSKNAKYHLKTKPEIFREQDCIFTVYLTCLYRSGDQAAFITTLHQLLQFSQLATTIAAVLHVVGVITLQRGAWPRGIIWTAVPDPEPLGRSAHPSVSPPAVFWLTLLFLEAKKRSGMCLSSQ